MLSYFRFCCISISTFPSFLGLPIGITSSWKGLKICATTARIEKHESTIKKKEIYMKKYSIFSKV